MKTPVILDRSDPILRAVALPVPVSEISSEKVKKIVNEMIRALESQEDGVAIAAPQIGYGVRIFVVSGTVESMIKGSESETFPHTIYINPVITKRSRKKSSMEEGCLSIRYLYGKVKRHDKVTLEAYNEHGQKIVRGASGLLSQIFQHETDHLDGILFTDTASDVKDIPPSKHS